MEIWAVDGFMTKPSVVRSPIPLRAEMARVLVHEHELDCEQSADLHDGLPRSAVRTLAVQGPNGSNGPRPFSAGFTPRHHRSVLDAAAAQQASWVFTQMTPKAGEELFGGVGNMAPSKSSLDRLPKALGERWESEQEKYEQVLREALVIPEGTRTIALTIDGGLAPIDGGNHPSEVRADAAAEGRLCKGPVGYREVGCATLAFCDDKGDLISALRFGRGPESKKLSLKETLRKDLAHVLGQPSRAAARQDHRRGQRQLEHLATLPEGPEILDFFHATEHLADALAAIHGDGTFTTRTS